MMVLDASALLEVLMRTVPGISLEQHIFQPGETLHAPHLIDLEVLQVLRRYVQRRDMSVERASEAVEDFADLPIARYPHEPFIGRIWELLGRVTAYDAAYVALAEALDAPLETRDRRLAGASGHRANVRLLGNH